MRLSLSIAAGLFSAIIFFTACGTRTQPQKAAPAQKLEPVKAEPGEVPPKELRKEEPAIKVRRDKTGEYTWEISGKNLRAIIDADRALRKRFGEGKSE